MGDRIQPNDDDTELPEASAEHKERYAINERTGLEYVKRRPGQRLVTSEEIRKELEDFP
jgi:hypothetical protein